MTKKTKQVAKKVERQLEAADRMKKDFELVNLKVKIDKLDAVEYSLFCEMVDLKEKWYDENTKDVRDVEKIYNLVKEKEDAWHSICWDIAYTKAIYYDVIFNS